MEHYWNIFLANASKLIVLSRELRLICLGFLDIELSTGFLINKTYKIMDQFFFSWEYFNYRVPRIGFTRIERNLKKGRLNSKVAKWNTKRKNKIS